MTSRTGRVGGRRTGGRSAHGRGDGVTRSVVVAGFPIGFPVGLSCGGWVRGGPAAGFGGGGRVPTAGGPPGDRQERLQLLWGTVMTGYLWGNRARTDERSPERAHRDGAGRGVDAGGWAPRHAEGGNMTMDARGTTFPASTESVDAGVAGSAARCARPSAATTSPHRSCAGRSTAACSGRSGAVSSANEVSMSRAHRVSPPRGGWFTALLLRRASTAHCRNGPECAVTRPYNAPPSPDLGGVDLGVATAVDRRWVRAAAAALRAALPSTRTEIANRHGTSGVAVPSEGDRPQADGSTPGTLALARRQQQVGVDVIDRFPASMPRSGRDRCSNTASETRRSLTCSRARAPRTGSSRLAGGVPAVRRVGSIVRRVNGEQNVPGSARSERASAHGAAAHLPEDPDDRRLRRPPRLTGRPR